MNSISHKPVVLLAKKNANREQFVLSLKAAELRPLAVDTFAEVPAAFEASGSEVLVHVLDGFERNEVGLFHHRLVRSPDTRHLARFIVYQGSNERAVCFAHDLGMLKAVQGERALTTLGYSVALALQSFLNLDKELRDVLTLAASGDCCVAPGELERWQKLAKDFPNQESLLIASARAGMVLNNNFEKAMQLSKRLLDVNPKDVRAMTLAGDAHLFAGKLADSARCILAAEMLATGNPSRLATVARIAAMQGDLATAKRCLQTAIDIYPVVRSIKPVIELLNYSEEERRLLFETLRQKLPAEDIAFLADAKDAA
ncbi:MAG: hypothetical protein RI953_1358 [Pseudomonadota bacterium]